jgi:hypothetical protein
LCCMQHLSLIIAEDACFSVAKFIATRQKAPMPKVTRRL